MSFSTLTENTFLNVEKSIGFNAEDYIAQVKKRYFTFYLNSMPIIVFSSLTFFIVWSLSKKFRLNKTITIATLVLLIGLSQIYVTLSSKNSETTSDEMELYTADGEYKTSAESFIAKPKRLAKLRKDLANSSDHNKIKSSIKINTGSSSFITITSTIVSNGKLLTVNKIAEVTYEINIPELDLNVNVMSDILLNPNQTQTMPVNSTRLAQSKSKNLV